MADAYWRYGDGGKQQPPAIPPQVAKRPRAEFEMSSGHDMPNLYAHRGDRTVINDIDAINASYDRYLRSAQISSLGGEPGRPMAMNSELLARLHHDDPRITAVRGPDPSMATKNPPVVVRGPPGIPLPPDASNTLYVEGLPANCTRREVAHIFRPFVGYKEVRLVSKESRRPGGDQLVLCFVDFQSPAHAATAMDAIQGYEFDEHDRDMATLRLQFARFPGARSGGGNRGRR